MLNQTTSFEILPAYNFPPDTADDLLSKSDLNPSQKAFCKDLSRKIRMLAPAGNGKTDSLLWRCLTQMRIYGENDPQRFLIFTFTKIARAELENRLKKDENFAELQRAFYEKDIIISTLNSWGCSYLIKNAGCKFENNKNLKWLIQNELRRVAENYPPIKESFVENRRSFDAMKDLAELTDEFKSLGYRYDLHGNLNEFLKHSEWLFEAGLQESVLKVLEKLKEYKIVGDDFEFPDTFVEIFNNFSPFWREAVESLYAARLFDFEDQKYWTLIELEKSLKISSGSSLVVHILNYLMF